MPFANLQSGRRQGRDRSSDPASGFSKVTSESHSLEYHPVLLQESKMRGNPLFVQKGGPRTAIMHHRASECIERCQSQDACWLHAVWSRSFPQSARNRGIICFAVGTALV